MKGKPMFRIASRVNFCSVKLRALSNLETAVQILRNRENLGLGQIGADISEN